MRKYICERFNVAHCQFKEGSIRRVNAKRKGRNQSCDRLIQAIY